VVYGLFHGLVFLPVLLSIIGPAPYASAVSEDENNENEVKEMQVLLLVNQNNEACSQNFGKPCCTGNTVRLCFTFFIMR